MRVLPGHLAAEHPGVRVLFLVANAPMAIHAMRPVSSTADLAGLRVRSAGAVVAATLAALGAVPANVMPLDVPAALADGRIDAAAMTFEGAMINRLAGVVSHSLELNVNTVTFGLVMNAQRHAALAPDLQAASMTCLALGPVTDCSEVGRGGRRGAALHAGRRRYYCSVEQPRARLCEITSGARIEGNSRRARKQGLGGRSRSFRFDEVGLNLRPWRNLSRQASAVPARLNQPASAATGITRWHRTARLDPMPMSCGASTVQRSNVCMQRGANAHPLGMSARLGGAPGIGVKTAS